MVVNRKIKCPGCSETVDRNCGWCPNCHHRIVGTPENEMLLEDFGHFGIIHNTPAEKERSVKQKVKDKERERLFTVIFFVVLISIAVYYSRDRRTTYEKYMDARCELEQQAATVSYGSGQAIDQGKISSECSSYLETIKNSTQ